MGIKSMLAKRAINRGKGIVEKKTKKIKRIVLLICILLGALLVLTIFFVFKTQLDNLLKSAAISNLNKDWIFHASDSYGKQFDKGEVDDINGGLSGFGIDIEYAISNMDDSDVRKMLLQVAQLYDVASVESKNPCTLVGLALLTKECGFWTKSDGAILDSGCNDIYKYGMVNSVYKTPPSNRGGGKVWHVVKSAADYDKYYPASHVLNAGAGATSANSRLKSGTVGYFNHGAYGIVQIEGNKWISNAWTWAGVSDVTSSKSHLSKLREHEAFVCSVMEKVGHPEFLNEYTTKSYGDYEAFVVDLGNLTTNVMATVTYFTAYYPILNSYLGDAVINGNGGTADYAGDDWNEMTEQEKNVFASICWLQIWNGGDGCRVRSNSSSENNQIKYRLVVDLAKYLVKNGSQPIIDAGWSSVSNASNTSLNEDEKARLKKHFKALTDVVYAADSIQKEKAYNTLVNDYINGGSSATYSGYIYSLDGIIRAQAAANLVANAAGYTGQFNIYQAKYSGQSNYEATNTQEVIRDALEFMNKNVGCEYSQSLRMNDGKFDCSSYIARAFASAGYNGFMTTGGMANTAAGIAKAAKDNGANVIYEANFQEKCMKRSGERNIETSGYGMIPELSGEEVDLSNFRIGDLIFWDYDTSCDGDIENGGRFMWIDHVAMYVGDGKVAEAVGSGTSTSNSIYGTKRIALVLRLNDNMNGLQGNSANSD